MDCNESQNLMSALIDEELDVDLGAALEAHLEKCDECRATFEVLRAQNTELQRAFQPARDAASRIANRVIDALPSSLAGREVSPAERGIAKPKSAAHWPSLLLATAVGVLVTVLVLQPWNAREELVRLPPVIRPRTPIEPVPFQPHPEMSLVAATGRIEVRRSMAADWTAVSEKAALYCSSEAALRTGPDVRCELRTAKGSVVRLDEKTEVGLISADTIEVKHGRIWCSSPQNVSLKVLTRQSDAPVDKSPPLPSFQCPSNASLLTTVQKDGRVNLTTARGEVPLQTKGGLKRLKIGETATNFDGTFDTVFTHSDPLLAQRWINVLLIKKGHNDGELASRVNELLARIGRTKMSVLYENEIRSLGEYSVLPLIRFVQSPVVGKDRSRRIAAARIAADLAPIWVIADLIDLLTDSDPEVRFHAARALKRLTNQTQGREPELWREAWPKCRKSHERWKRWWRENAKHYPSRVVSKTGNPG